MHQTFIIFLFLLGACIGSFINVVVWRYPRSGWKSLLWPPSHCPKCEHRLAWYDNIPVFGWIFLGGKCRYCRAGISVKYPIFEFITGAILVFYYLAFFIWQIGPCPMIAVKREFDPFNPDAALGGALSILTDWPIFSLYMFMLMGLLVSSLIDAEHFIIPPEIPWLIAIVAFVMHSIWNDPYHAGALNLVMMNTNRQLVASTGSAIAAGGAVGLLISIILWAIGIIPTSFPEGEPVEELDRDQYAKDLAQAKAEGRTPDYDLPPTYTRKQVRAEIGKEMAFLLPAMILALGWFLMTYLYRPIGDWWLTFAAKPWLSSLLGSMLGAMIGGFVVWLARILGTLTLGRLAMGLGDVHLMFGVGAVIGAGASTVAFFLAPFAALVYGFYRLITKKRHELPLGPYLSLATAFVILMYCPIADHFLPGFQGLSQWIHDMWSH